MRVTWEEGAHFKFSEEYERQVELNVSALLPLDGRTKRVEILYEGEGQWYVVLLDSGGTEIARSGPGRPR
jgi:hypothetical protein